MLRLFKTHGPYEWVRLLCHAPLSSVRLAAHFGQGEKNRKTLFSQAPPPVSQLLFSFRTTEPVWWPLDTPRPAVLSLPNDVTS